LSEKLRGNNPAVRRNNDLSTNHTVYDEKIRRVFAKKQAGHNGKERAVPEGNLGFLSPGPRSYYERVDKTLQRGPRKEGNRTYPHDKEGVIKKAAEAKTPILR